MGIGLIAVGVALLTGGLCVTQHFYRKHRKLNAAKANSAPKFISFEIASATAEEAASAAEEAASVASMESPLSTETCENVIVGTPKSSDRELELGEAFGPAKFPESEPDAIVVADAITAPQQEELVQRLRSMSASSAVEDVSQNGPAKFVKIPVAAGQKIPVIITPQQEELSSAGKDISQNNAVFEF